jgi:hypothetical protein
MNGPLQPPLSGQKHRQDLFETQDKPFTDPGRELTVGWIPDRAHQ